MGGDITVNYIITINIIIITTNIIKIITISQDTLPNEIAGLKSEDGWAMLRVTYRWFLIILLQYLI